MTTIPDAVRLYQQYENDEKKRAQLVQQIQKLCKDPLNFKEFAEVGGLEILHFLLTVSSDSNLRKRAAAIIANVASGILVVLLERLIILIIIIIIICLTYFVL